MEQRKKFKPFERVIFLTTEGDENNAKWECGFYSYYDNAHNIHVLVGQFWVCDKDILPFAGNETLVGMGDMPEEAVELLDGDLIIAFDNVEVFLDKFEGGLTQFRYPKNGSIYTYVGSWKYCIPFSKFNPNDVRETRKHILCVKDNKLVRAEI